MAADVLSDAPESADQYEFSVEDGDVIMLATDGVFDNIPDSILVEEIGTLQNGTLDPAEIQVNINETSWPRFLRIDSEPDFTSYNLIETWNPQMTIFPNYHDFEWKIC